MSNSEKSSILVVESQVLPGEALAKVLNRQKDMICCAAANEWQKVPFLVENHKPSLIVTDTYVDGREMVELVPELMKIHSSVKFLVYARIDNMRQVEKLLKAGVSGYVSKQDSTEEVLTAIRTVLGGEIYLPRKVASRILYNFVCNSPLMNSEAKAKPIVLTRRETEVLQFIGSGRKTSEVAAEMKISVKTVETHRENIKRKFGVKNSAELMLFAVQWLEGNVPKSLLLKTLS